jgi:putative heme-binding domain-containing protein
MTAANRSLAAAVSPGYDRVDGRNWSRGIHSQIAADDDFPMQYQQFLGRRTACISVAAAMLALVVGTMSSWGAAAGDIALPPGFRAELVYAVPLAQQGSWVSLAVDHRGRLVASDEKGGLYRIEPSPVGGKPAQTRVEPIPMSVGMAQGLLAVGDKLYVVMNGRVGAFSSGLYRLSDANGDDRYDRLEQLRVFQGEGEHGPHAVVLGPDGKSLYIVAGNFTRLTSFDGSLVPTELGEDQLLPRIYDPNGHANELKPPAGWIARTDLDGRNFEIVSIGFRNAYDMAFNDDGELLTFDSDMEWDIGTPWYRPTRICHVTAGTDWGWRSGNGPWPPYYPDTVPPVVNVGPGSPTGVAFGKGTKFPGRYQNAFFVGDWSYGNIYAIHLTPEGSSYRGEVERFAAATPLAVTDMVVRPQDGALYFAVGGRRSESALYRIVATEANAPTAAAEPAPSDVASALEPLAPADARKIRRSLEALFKPKAGAVDQAWPHLAHADRFIRYAARTAIEHQPVAEWRQRALAEPNADARVQALVALARMSSRDDQPAWTRSLVELDFAEASRDQRLALLRAAGLGAIRFDPMPEDSRERLLAAFDAHYPTGDYLVDRELAPLLVRLAAPQLLERLLSVLDRAATQEEGIDAALALVVIRDGWSIDQRKRFLDWFDQVAARGGGHSYFGYVVAARNRFIDGFTAADRQTLSARISKPFAQMSPSTATTTPRPFVREWKLDELAALAEKDDPAKRDLQNGRRMFAAANCYACHRIGGEGSSVGPDLTGVGRRFVVRDILRAIVEPNQVVSDQYRQTVFETGGRLVVGRVTNISGDKITVSTDMLNPVREVDIRRDEIDEQYPSDASVMPEGLLNTLTEAEILDLLAYLRAAGAEGPTPAGGGASPPAAAP